MDTVEPVPVRPVRVASSADSDLARIQSFLAPSTITDKHLLACTCVVENTLPIDVTVLEVRASSPTADLQEALTINERGFDPAALDVTAEASERFRPSLEGGGAIIVRWRDVGVSTGMWLPISSGVTELVGITTLQEFRRNGFGLTTVVALTSAAVHMGADLVFLTTNDLGAHGVYRRAGYRDVELQGSATE